VENSDLPIGSKEWQAVVAILEKEEMIGGERWCHKNTVVYRESKLVPGAGHDFCNVKSVFLTCRVCKYRIFRLRGGNCGNRQFTKKVRIHEKND